MIAVHIEFAGQVSWLALAASIVLVCGQRSQAGPVMT
jgi:hypothetical protein